MSAPRLDQPGRTWRGSAVLRAAPWVAGAWALAFGTLSGLALLGRTADPWVPDVAAPLGGLDGGQVSVVIAVTALLTALTGLLAAWAVARDGERPAQRRTQRGLGWLLVGLGLVTALVIADVSSLTFLGYLPQIVLALVDVGPGAGKLEWALVLDSAKSVAHTVGGLATVVAGIGVLQRAEPGGRISWGRWARWGRPTVAIAMVVPLVYAVTRIAWALNIPLGVRSETLDGLGSGRFAGLGLALFAVVGSILTWGLVARWGEVFWAWVPRIGRRPVPVAMAVVPGLVVATAVTSAGLSFWRLLLSGDIWAVPATRSTWAAWAPEVLWPLWGVALAVACLAYLGRRTEPAR